MAESEYLTSSVPIPDDPAGDISDECRLWIGNMDTRLTEYSMLKILQKFGSLRRFDFIYHKSGPDKGKSKGYCFVSYDRKQDAQKAVRCLNGKLALSKKLFVKWAHAEKQDDTKVCKATDVKISETDTISPESKIRAIEAKLKSMEDSRNDFTLSFKPSAPPGSSSLSTVNSQTKTKMMSQRNNKKPYKR